MVTHSDQLRQIDPFLIRFDGLLNSLENEWRPIAIMHEMNGDDHLHVSLKMRDPSRDNVHVFTFLYGALPLI